MVRTEQWRGPATTLLWICAVALAYAVTGLLGLIQRVEVEGASVTPLWLPTGIALAALLRFGLRIWPGIAVGAGFVVHTLSAFEPVDLGIVAGNTLAPLCAYALLRRTGFRAELDRLRDGLALVFLGGLLPMLISATIGTGVIVLDGGLPAARFWPVWWAWWAGDAMGVLVGTPLLLALPMLRIGRDHLRTAEWAAMLVSTTVVAEVATRSEQSLLFLVFPLLIWAAVRFQLAGAAPCTLIVSFLAISAAIDHDGPFADHSLFQVMVNLQALNGSAALTGLLLAALVTEQNNIRRKVEKACEELAELVATLPRGNRDA
ncbi:MASE1 domain-containing protein [Streptomyces bambusae]|nr:MASE1 domain-containing protein [Streptomyces bambusae]MCB5164245.1 MASE1 domain-containing protein [Streptomyces bambusae]